MLRKQSKLEDQREEIKKNTFERITQTQKHQRTDRQRPNPARDQGCRVLIGQDTPVNQTISGR